MLPAPTFWKWSLQAQFFLHTHFFHTHSTAILISQGILHAAYCMRRDEGVIAFYRGLVPSMIGILPYAGGHSFVLCHGSVRAVLCCAVLCDPLPCTVLR